MAALHLEKSPPFARKPTLPYNESVKAAGRRNDPIMFLEKEDAA